MSQAIDPNTPTLFVQALKALHAKDEKAYSALFLPRGNPSYREKSQALRRMLNYISTLRSQGYVTVERKAGDAIVTLTEKGLTEIVKENK